MSTTYGGGKVGLSAYELYAQVETDAGRTPDSLEDWVQSLGSLGIIADIGGFYPFSTREGLKSWGEFSNAETNTLVTLTNGTSFIKDGGTSISDMTGWSPLGKPRASHWADNTTPGTTDMGAAVISALEYSRDNNISFEGEPEDIFLGTSEVKIYRSLDLNGGRFTLAANGQTNPQIVVATDSSDEDTSDDTLLAIANTSTPLYRGQTRIPELAAYKGKSLRLSSSSAYITRSDLSTYRYEIFIEVVDDEGGIYPPIPFDVPSSVSFTTAESRTIKDPVVLRNFSVLVDTNSTDVSTNIMEVNRPHVTIDGAKIVNNTTARFNGGIKTENVTTTRILNSEITGANEESTNYGINFASGGITVENCNVTDCRRSFDANYGHTALVRNCYLSDGVGAHLGFDINIINNHISYDSPNSAAVLVSGGDFYIKDNIVNIEDGSGAAFVKQRADVPEIKGNLIIDRNSVVFNTDGETSTFNQFALDLQFQENGYNTGRDLYLPTNISIKDNNFDFINGTPTISFYLYRVDDDYTDFTSDDLIVNQSLKISNNNINVGSGPTVNEYLRVVKRANWTGEGIDAVIDDLGDSAEIRMSAEAGVSDTCRFNIRGERIGTGLTFVSDPKAYKDVLLGVREYPTVTISTNNTTLNDSEIWFKVNGSSPIYIIGTINDDSVERINFLYEDFFEIDVYQRNADTSANYEKLIVDLVGSASDGLTSVLSVGGATTGYYSEALTGTTGTNNNLNFGADADTSALYIENRTGSSLTGVAVVKTKEG